MEKQLIHNGLVPGINAILLENRYALSAEDEQLLRQCVEALTECDDCECAENFTEKQIEFAVIAARLLLKFFNIDLD